MKMPDEMQLMLADVDSYFKINLGFAPSVTEFLESKDPMLQGLSKGFEYSFESTMVANWKETIMTVMKDGMPKMIMGPLLELALDAHTEIELDDFEDLKENPMLIPFMSTFPELLESKLNVTPNQLNNFMKDYDENASALTIASDTATHIKDMIKYCKSAWMVVKLCDDIKEKNTEFGATVFWPDMGVLEYKISTDGYGKAI